MNRPDTVKALTYAQALWPSFTLPTDPGLYDLAVHAWAGMLAEPTLAEVIDALRELSAGGGDFAPTPGQVRRHILDIPAPGEMALRALAEVQAQIRAEGWVGAPTWADPALPLVIQALGGWQAVCEATNPEAFRAHFLRLYEPMARRAAADAAAPAALTALTARPPGDRAITDLRDDNGPAVAGGGHPDGATAKVALAALRAERGWASPDETSEAET